MPWVNGDRLTKSTTKQLRVSSCVCTTLQLIVTDNLWMGCLLLANSALSGRGQVCIGLAHRIITNSNFAPDVTTSTWNSNFDTKGRVPLPNRMNFCKNSKRPLTSPPPFSENYVAIFYDRYGCIYARRYDGQIVWNAYTWLPEIGTILRGRRWWSTAVWNLSENSSD